MHLYAAFVERGLGLLRLGGYRGAITRRTGFFLTSFRRWREEILLQKAQLIALTDLGYGVVETAASVVICCSRPPKPWRPKNRPASSAWAQRNFNPCLSHSPRLAAQGVAV